jgi:SAM-dependent methyltransferase
VEKVICDLCGADAPIHLFNRKDRFSGREFEFVNCSNCGLIYLQSRPTQEELANYYPSDYEAYYLIDEDSSGSHQWHLQRALNLQLDFVEQTISSKGNLLDIGCATGNFMKFAQDKGWQVFGIEPIEEAAKIARENYQLDVITGTLDSVYLDDESFDVITMWDVLEHLPSPKNTLIRCNNLLKADGILVFSIPNLISFDRYLFLGGKGTFLLSLDQLLGDGRLGSIIKPTYPVLSAALWPYRQISYQLNRGPIITYAFRKKGSK